MNPEVEKDPVFQKMIKQLNFPNIFEVGALAKKYNVNSMAAFWDFFEMLQARRRGWRKTG